MNPILTRIREIHSDAEKNRIKDPASVLKACKDAEALLDECPEAEVDDFLENLRLQAYCLDQTSQYPEAMDLALRGLDRAEKFAKPGWAAQFHNLLGKIHWRLDDYSRALNHYLLGLEVVPDDDKHRQFRSSLVSGLGIVYYAQSDYEHALEYFRKSLEITSQDDWLNLGDCNNNIAYMLHLLGRDQEALAPALEAIRLFNNQDGVSLGKMETFHTIGSIYLGLRQYEHAWKYFSDSVNLARQAGNLYHQIEGQFGICQVLFHRNEYHKARQILVWILDTAKEIGSKVSEAESHHKLSQVYKAMGDFRASLEHFEHYHQLYKELEKEKSDRQTKTLQILHEVSLVREQAKVYHQLASIDSLTGLLNRRAFFETMERNLRQCVEDKKSVSVLMIDIDNLKEINDRNGHLFGDAIITEVARRLHSCLREHDLIGRYGGDEFAVFLSGLNRENSLLIAERCNQAVAQGDIIIEPVRLRSSVSIGMAWELANGQTNVIDLVNQADRALLASKKNGRNCVTEFSRES